LESKDVVAGEQNIERQSVFLKDVSAPRFLSEDKASPPHFYPCSLPEKEATGEVFSKESGSVGGGQVG